MRLTEGDWRKPNQPKRENGIHASLFEPIRVVVRCSWYGSGVFGETWAKVSLFVPGRTTAQCRERWGSLCAGGGTGKGKGRGSGRSEGTKTADGPGRGRKVWKPEDDATLIRLVESLPSSSSSDPVGAAVVPINWAEISLFIGGGKSAASVRTSLLTIFRWILTTTSHIHL